MTGERFAKLFADARRKTVTLLPITQSHSPEHPFEGGIEVDPDSGRPQCIMPRCTFDAEVATAVGRPPTLCYGCLGDHLGEASALTCPKCGNPFFDTHDESAMTSFRYHLEVKHPDEYERIKAAFGGLDAE